MDVTSETEPILVDPNPKPPSKLTSFGRLLTKTATFRYLVDKNFDIMDDSGDGVIDQAELYAGLLLMHISLAKNAGPAACFPPDRATVDRMFRAADVDKDGVLCKKQFHWIMGIMCAQILGRMFVFYAVMIVTVPICATRVILWTHIPQNTYDEHALRTAIGILVMYFITPWLWGKIDAHYAGQAPNPDELLLTADRKEERKERSGKRASTNETI